MATLKVTQRLRSAINQAARQHVRAANLYFEAGYREAVGGRGELHRGSETVNARLWPEENDLSDLVKLADLKVVALDDSGRCELDLYAYGGAVRQGRDYRELITNVYVLFDAGGVLDSYCVGEEEQVAKDPRRAELWRYSAETVATWRDLAETNPSLQAVNGR
jgi:hypothetical protein